VFLERRQTVEGPELLTRTEVALYLRTPTTTLAQWASRGIGPHYTKVGRKTLYRRADLERWFQEQESAQRGEPVG
jgi:excisionase family DNA binding protein